MRESGCASGPADLRCVRDPDSEGGSEQVPCAHSGLGATRAGSERDHEADQRAPGKQAVRIISRAEEALLGKAFLGARVHLCHGRGDDRGEDQAVLGASF